jgi:acetaldehyde/propanal dehydrogenase
MSKKLRAAIIGPGNIGTDLLMKAMRSEWIEPVWMVGVEDSPGIQRAKGFGMKTTTDGVDGLVPHIKADNIQIAFDATSAYVHAENSRKVTELGVMMIDLTPAAIGPFCIPPVNLQALLAEGAKSNVNMVTCGGQATIPMVAAVSRVQPVSYAEIVAWPPQVTMLTLVLAPSASSASRLTGGMQNGPIAAGVRSIIITPSSVTLREFSACT